MASSVDPNDSCRGDSRGPGISQSLSFMNSQLYTILVRVTAFDRPCPVKSSFDSRQVSYTKEGKNKTGCPWFSATVLP